MTIPLTQGTEDVPGRDEKTNSWIRIDGMGFISLRSN